MNSPKFIQRGEIDEGLLVLFLLTLFVHTGCHGNAAHSGHSTVVVMVTGVLQVLIFPVFGSSFTAEAIQ